MTTNELLEQSFAELQAQVKKHHEIMRLVANGGSPSRCCALNACPHEQMLRNLIVETVQVLEETRKAFKSKQLEHLRKRLLQALTQEPGHKPAHNRPA